MDFLQIIMTPFSWLLRVFCQVFDSYGIALILFTIVVKLILFPFNLKAKKSMIKMNLISGQLKEIQKRCGNDRERYNQEVQKFYSENNVSPMGGCGWSLLPLVILYPLYAIIRRPFRYMMNLTDNAITSVANALGWSDYATMTGAYKELTLAADLNSTNLATASAAAGSSLFVINFTFLGLHLEEIPQLMFWQGGIDWNSIGLFLLPIISAVLSFLSMLVSQRTNRMNRNQELDKSTASTNRTMMIISPLISLWIGYSMPAGLCVYWIANSLLMMVQEVICGKILRKDYEAAQREMEEQARKAKEEEKERRRIAAEKKAAAIASGSYKKGKKLQTKAKVKGTDVAASREGMRTYARGRAYDPDRYPITPYRDPDDKYKKKEPEEELTPLTEEEKAILAENGVPIPEMPQEDITETAGEDVHSEIVPEEPSAPFEATEKESSDEGDYEPPYEEEDPKEKE